MNPVWGSTSNTSASWKMAALEEEEEFIAACRLSRMDTYIIWLRRNIKDDQKSSFGFKAVRRVLTDGDPRKKWGEVD